MHHSFSSLSDFQFNLILFILFLILAIPVSMAVCFAIELIQIIKIGILQEEERETNSNG